MPSRFIALMIVGFWLTLSGWLFYRDLRPRLWPKDPPFSIDLADEVRAATDSWKIYRNGMSPPVLGASTVGLPGLSVAQSPFLATAGLLPSLDIGYIRSQIQYSEADDTFALVSEAHIWGRGRQPSGDPDQLLDTYYRHTREGVLTEIGATILFDSDASNDARQLLRKSGGKKELKPRIDLTGMVQNGLFTPHWRLQAFGAIDRELDSEPVKLNARGHLQNWLAPMNRLRNLRRGQEWDLALIDPLSDSREVLARELAPGQSTPLIRVRWLHARILPETKLLAWGPVKGRSEAAEPRPLWPCLVIEYTADYGLFGWTYIREKDGLVLQQEMDQGLLKLIRD